ALAYGFHFEMEGDGEFLVGLHHAFEFDRRREVEIREGDITGAHQMNYALPIYGNLVIDLYAFAGAGQVNVYPTSYGLGFLAEGRHPAQRKEIDTENGVLLRFQSFAQVAGHDGVAAVKVAQVQLQGTGQGYGVPVLGHLQGV